MVNSGLPTETSTLQIASTRLAFTKLFSWVGFVKLSNTLGSAPFIVEKIFHYTSHFERQTRRELVYICLHAYVCSLPSNCGTLWVVKHLISPTRLPFGQLLRRKTGRVSTFCHTGTILSELYNIARPVSTELPTLNCATTGCMCERVPYLDDNTRPWVAWLSRK